MSKEKSNVDVDVVIGNVLLVLSILGVLISIYYSFKFITKPQIVNIILVLPFLFLLAPYLVMNLFRVKRVENKMEIVPRFLRDIVDNVESGMDIITAIKNTQTNEYILLNEDIKKFANQLSWGVDFEEALLNFSNNIGSKHLKHDFLLIIEARKVGGHVEKLLRELSEKINEENLRSKERRSNLASNTFTGYISFIIFLFIIIVVYNNLFVELGSSIMQSNSSLTNSDPSQLLVYLTLLIFLSYELAIFSGFLFGLMQEGNIIAGAPHVVALVVITFIAFFFFITI